MGDVHERVQITARYDSGGCGDDSGFRGVDLAILEGLSIWSNHVQAKDATEGATVTTKMTTTTSEAAEVADGAKGPTTETRKKDAEETVRAAAAAKEAVAAQEKERINRRR